MNWKKLTRQSLRKKYPTEAELSQLKQLPKELKVTK